MAFNISSIKTSSNGAWQGDNPLHYAFPLLIIQTTLILIVTRSLAFLLKPLRQPKVIAEIIGGIILGPSALGRNKTYMHSVFPSWSIPILESVASIGLLFFLFLVGLELDLTSIRRSGRRAFSIALAGISLPFISGIGVSIVLRKTVDGADKVGFAQFLVFMGVTLSITAFPVLARILAELNLLTTRVGETAIAAAAFNDVAAWILLALAVALAGDAGNNRKSPLVSVWVLLSGLGFVIFMTVVIRPLMKRVAQRCSSEHESVDEAYICLTLAGAMVSGFMTDLIGIHSIFGAFVFGLTIPKSGGFADRLIERIEDFISGLLLPLYFASSGLKTDVAKIRGAEAWGLLVLVISTACAGKIFGTFVVAVLCRIPVRESLTLGVLMNTNGLVELIVLNIGKEKKVLNDQMFAILVLMALFTTFITTPIVMAIYKPARDGSLLTHPKLGDLNFDSNNSAASDELRVLACVHGPGNVPSIISLIESSRSTNKSSLKLFIMHLVELTERSSSIIMAQRARKNGFPFFNPAHGHDPLAGAFQAYSHLGRVSVLPTTAISSLATMHEDICHVAEEKTVTMIILPFHKQWRIEPEEVEERESQHEMVENVGHAWRGVNQRVLRDAPCSVAVLVDRGFGDGYRSHGPNATKAQNVCILFFGGPDDREALKFGSRMAEHPVVKVTVVRFVDTEVDAGATPRSNKPVLPSPYSRNGSNNSYSFSTAKVNREREDQMDEAAVAEFKSKWEGGVVYMEQVGSRNVVEEVTEIGRGDGYDLMVVGKGRLPSRMEAGLGERPAEHAELGPIGDILASSDNGVKASVLVVQQHDTTVAEASRLGKLKVLGQECSSSTTVRESSV